MSLGIFCAYLLKEQFPQLSQEAIKEDARRFSEQCFGSVFFGPGSIRQSASVLRRHRAGVLEGFLFPVVSGAVEALNATGKPITTRARGYG